MNQEERLNISPLFAGLTRPPMLMGITLDYFCICFMIAISGFILANSFRYLILYIPLHISGWIACKIDHNIFRLIAKHLDCLKVMNKKIWGCQTYEPF